MWLLQQQPQRHIWQQQTQQLRHQHQQLAVAQILVSSAAVT
jgi:hypothetical protein